VKIRMTFDEVSGQFPAEASEGETNIIDVPEALWEAYVKHQEEAQKWMRIWDGLNALAEEQQLAADWREALAEDKQLRGIAPCPDRGSAKHGLAGANRGLCAEEKERLGVPVSVNLPTAFGVTPEGHFEKHNDHYRWVNGGKNLCSACGGGFGGYTAPEARCKC
jgi:hypothetical protein